MFGKIMFQVTTTIKHNSVSLRKQPFTCDWCHTYCQNQSANFR